jgi:hypothetical protein
VLYGTYYKKSPRLGAFFVCGKGDSNSHTLSGATTSK